MLLFTGSKKMLHLSFFYENTRHESAKCMEAYISSIKSASKYFKFFSPTCPRSYSPTAFPSISSSFPHSVFSQSFPHIFLTPSPAFPGVWHDSSNVLNSSLYVRRPGSLLCSHTPQVRCAARQVRTGGGYTWYSARPWRPTWAWEPAQSPGELLSRPRLILSRCSCLSNVPQGWPP